MQNNGTIVFGVIAVVGFFLIFAYILSKLNEAGYVGARSPYAPCPECGQRAYGYDSSNTRFDPPANEKYCRNCGYNKDTAMARKKEREWQGIADRLRERTCPNCGDTSYDKTLYCK